MQSPPDPNSMPAISSAWITWLVQPAIILAGTGLFVRLILVPAMIKLIRADFSPEIAKVERHDRDLPALEQRVALTEETLQLLQTVPVSLARIEENLKFLTQRRRDDRAVHSDLE
jgi:hypothetical protein